MKTCSIEGCPNKYLARGWCSVHYEKWRMHGTPFAEDVRRRRGQGSIREGGYLLLNKNGESKLEHRRIIEKALGHPIPEKAIPHHVDGNGGNNETTNLVLCDSQAYHMLLHQRTRAYRACGHAGWRFCRYCHKYDHPDNMYHEPNAVNSFHRECDRIAKRAYYLRSK